MNVNAKMLAAVQEWMEKTLVFARMTTDPGAAIEAVADEVIRETERIRRRVQGNRMNSVRVTPEDARLMVQATLERATAIMAATGTAVT